MYPENSQTTEDSHMLQTTPHTTASTDKIEGPNPTGTENWCCVQDPLRNVPKGIHCQTSRTLKHRLAEHRRALRSDEATLSAAAKHALKGDHTIKWDDAEVVGQPCPTVLADMRLRSLAYETGKRQNEQG